MATIKLFLCMPGIETLVSAGFGLASGALQNRSAKVANDRAWNQTRRLFNMQQLDRDAQNRYNAPAQTIARLVSAGLSPASYYGNGQIAGTSAGVASPGSAEVNTPDIAGAMSSGVNAGLNALVNPQELELRRGLTSAEIDNLRAQTAKAFSESAKTDFERSQAEELRATVVERAKADLQNAYKQGVVLEKEAMLKDVDVRYREAGIKLTENQISLNDKQKELIDKQMEKLGFDMRESVTRMRLNNAQANLADATANEIVYRVDNLLPAMVADFCASKDLKSAQYWNTEAQTDFQKYYNEHIDELLGDKVRAEIKNMDAETKLATARKVQSWIKLPGEVFKDISFGASALMSGISGKGGISSSAGAYVMSTAM